MGGAPPMGPPKKGGGPPPGPMRGRLGPPGSPPPPGANRFEVPMFMGSWDGYMGCAPPPGGRLKKLAGGGAPGGAPYRGPAGAVDPICAATCGGSMPSGGAGPVPPAAALLGWGRSAWGLPQNSLQRWPLIIRRLARASAARSASLRSA